MVSIPYLDKADLAPLADAAASWKALPAKYEALQREFEQRVINHLKGHWDGDAADAAFVTMGKARTEYENAATEAERIAKLLLDAHGEFTASQKQLHALLDEARTDHYKVYDDGRVEDVDPRQDSPTASASPGLAEERKKKLDSLVSRLTRVLEVATAADEAASSALERDANGDSQSFNTSVYTTLDAVEADQAAALMNKKDRLSDAEITKLNLLLSANKNDPEFSREFAVKTGGENMLSKYNELMSPPAGTTLSKEQLAQLKQLKANLGTTIGTATTSDDHRKGGPDPEITKFQNDLLKAGQRDFNANPTESPYGLSGYQLTSSLMSEGKWDKDFLQDYGDALITAEKNGANAGQNPDAYWGYPRTLGSTNIGALDPMTGFMDALGHNPDASTEFLTSDATIDGEKVDHLDYLLKDRHWPEGAGYTGDSGNPSGYNNLGHAMESATSGRPFDSDGDPVKHTAERAALMNELVNTIGGDPGLISGSPRDEMRDSLGNMTAEYMADVQAAFGNEQGTIKPFGEPVNPPKGFETGTLVPFLANVGRDPDAYVAISESSQANTAIWMQEVAKQHPGYDEMTPAMENVAHPGGVVAGILSDARDQAIFEEHSASDKDFNDAVATGDKWAGRGLGMAVGAATGAAAPIVGTIAGWAVEDIQAMVVDQVQQDTTDEAQKEAYARYADGRSAVRDSTADSLREAIRNSGVDMSPQKLDTLAESAARAADDGHTTGATWNSSGSGR
ncbi:MULTISPECIES: hypothetical protein [unclassified Streptomyces]|jgi:hypothetical protein|uniref:hypothetical protein n=1 Tax=unclassified Streptomyces TaxID=2593676 RepID=UPI000F51576C|nr:MULTISPECIES: hypothetical protein [unclassified Streptomyces]QUC57007.1 hypothetical protein IOD14_09465 [Streptomyces sp. A2-16]GLP72780.1 hypothetical protein TUSST3_93960 [Streptomyces sp. TUS-ST3]